MSHYMTRQPFHLRSISAAEEITSLIANGATESEVQQFVHALRIEAHAIGVLDVRDIETERATETLKRLLKPGLN